MDMEELTQQLYELIAHLSLIEKTQIHINMELTYWRERYLTSIDKEENPDKGAYVWLVFKSTPCQEMMKMKPENVIKAARKGYEETHK